MPDEKDQALGLAIKVVDIEYRKLGEREKDEDENTAEAEQWLHAKPPEGQQRTALSELLKGYASATTSQRPLCIAVFGAPGSGKTRAVKSILKSNAAVMEFPGINLTQMPDPRAVAASLLLSKATLPEGKIPAIFFDEFDAPLGSAPLGWLPWFLAPMQDGHFVYDARLIELKRAIYVFAGGTCSTWREFSSRVDDEFRRAKGPDFASRIRGYLEVRGVNKDSTEDQVPTADSKERLLRRAQTLRYEFRQMAEGTPGARFKVDPEFIKALLVNSRYRHGARSIGAIVELSRPRNRSLTPGEGEGLPVVVRDDLPDDHLIAIHADAGRLDEKAIGGPVALSGYYPDADSVEESNTKPFQEAWIPLAESLWREGATLAYAGGWTQEADKPTRPMLLLHEAAKQQPPVLRRTKESRSLIWSYGYEDERPQGWSDLVKPVSLKRPDRPLDSMFTSIVERFFKRLRMIERAVAVVVIGGTPKVQPIPKGSSTGHRQDRFPGIPEEVMLALALGKPVYVVGGVKGAAHDTGLLLALGHNHTEDQLPSFAGSDKAGREELKPIEDRLRPGPWTDLPISVDELRGFFKAHAIEGPLWPKNGLSLEENRRLFTAAPDSEDIASLVCRGLVRRFAR